MDYEKKYKESMAKMSKFLAKHDGFTISKDGEMYKELSEIFPELKESEGEKIRKTLINMFKGNHIDKVGDFTDKKIIAWLEKQGEQNPAWSEEDEMMLERILDIIGDLGTGEMCKDWLKFLKKEYSRNQSKSGVIGIRQ